VLYTKFSLLFIFLSLKLFKINIYYTYYNMWICAINILIMWSKLTLKKVIAIVKLSLIPTWCWPLPKDTIKLKVTCAGIYQYFNIIVLSSVAAGLINAMRNHFNDPVIIAKSISVLCPAIQVVCNIICCRINSCRLQVIIIMSIY